MAAVGDRLVIGIPGNPGAALISFSMFGRPALARLLGLGDGPPVPGSRVPARLAAALVLRGGRREYLTVRLEADGAGGHRAWAEPGSSACLSGMVRADGLLEVPGHVTRLEAGEEVTVTAL